MDRYRLFARLISRPSICRALAARSLGTASWLVNLRCASPNFFSFEIFDEPASPRQVVELRFTGSRCRVGLNASLITRHCGDQERLIDALLVLSGCRGVGKGHLRLNVGDFGDLPGLAFSESRPGYELIPDPYYVGTVLARALHQHFPERTVPWSQRRPVVFWRGSTTGSPGAHGWESLDRIRLCRIADHDPGRFDVGITGLVQLTPAEESEIRASGLMREHVHLRHFDRYRYQLDIDGNSNSWGFFNKLLTGSPVLKVASPGGYRQWYYDRLIPWKHFVPVAANLSDLVERVDWLFSHDAEARAIGAAARKLAISMSLRKEIEATRQIVARAFVGG